jgi:phage baseplate assembly protein W
VNRPDFGSGLLQMVFAPNSPELAAALQYAAHGALQKWLADVVQVQQLTVTADEGTLNVFVSYVIRRTATPASTTVQVPAPS